MSRASLLNFLQTLDKELRGKSDIYRRNTADRREQTFIYLPRVLTEELYEEFKFRGILKVFDNDDFKSFIDTKTKNILQVLRTNSKRYFNGRQVTVKGNQNYIQVTLASEVNPKRNAAYNNFVKLKTIYQTEIDSFVLELAAYLEKEYKIILTKTKTEFDKSTYTRRVILTDEKVERGSDLFEGGHVEGEGVLETRIRDAIDTSFNKNYTKRASSEILKSNLKVLGLDLEIVRDDTNDSHTFYIQSRVGNQTAGILSGAEKAKLQKQLNEAIEKLNATAPIAGLKGSDSVIERKQKQVLAKTADAFKGIKDVKLVGFEKLEKATKRNAKKSNKTKVAKPSTTIARVKAPKVSLARQKKKGVASSPLALIASLNAKLPQQILKNMGEPGLVNRSGRFASSVRVVNVSTTAQGYPSFGYTYQRNPYQVFEEGSRGNWSSQDRDPRNLINKSIREIAVEFAIGRFYTRRV